MKNLREYQEEAVAAGLAATGRGRGGTVHIATGGGKTVVASEIIRRHAGGYVLWVAKDWVLLEQAADSVAAQCPNLVLGRIGGSQSALCTLREVPDGANVVFTTLHTFFSRDRNGVYPYVNPPALIVWDECHWGESSRMGRRLTRYAKQQPCPILGLTATPRGHSKLPIVHQTTFWELVKLGYAARPIIDKVPTDTSWLPDLTSADGDFAPRSLRELGRDKRRNQIIVDYWRRHASICRQTLVFACDVEHAERLAAGLKRAGAAVGVVHFRRAGADNQSEIARYKRGELDVLVNVAMLTHGFDAPETRTVFLTRPTASPVLYSQMIGRGSRVAPGKSEFRIVCFTDNVEQHHECVMTPGMLFGEPSSSEPRRPARPARQDDFQHEFEVDGRLVNIKGDGVCSALDGLRYRQGQTFGIEIELTRPGFRKMLGTDDWTAKANALLAVLRRALPPGRVAADPCSTHHDPQLSFDVWNVELDSSCGWEVVGPKLANQEGFEEAMIACDLITEHAPTLGLQVNHRTGLHVHLGWKMNARWLQQLIAGTHQLEPLLASMVAPSRIAEFARGAYDTTRPNGYCAPVSSLREYRQLNRELDPRDVKALLTRMGETDRRYATVNLIPLVQHNAVEIRMHNGTTEAAKVLLWVSLWMQMLHHFERLAGTGASRGRLSRRTTIEPHGCLVTWLRENIPGIPPKFVERIDDRRQRIKGQWARSEQLREWVKTARAWQRPNAWSDAAE